jgi:hypothetical protein
MRLLEAQTGAHRAARATLIVAPYAAHDAEIADFAPGHSLAGVLLEAGAAPLALTAWKSATPAMRDFGIDAYLADLDAAVEHLGGRVALVGLCQGGWLGALYAARFPEKVARLALVGAPLDLKAAESAITRALAWTPSAFIAGAVALSGGRVLGASSFALWAPGLASEYEAAVALQCEPDAALRARYDAWLARRIDLPGRYFLETTEWLFRGNDLAENRFPALGRLCGLGHLTRRRRRPRRAGADDGRDAPLSARGGYRQNRRGPTSVVVHGPAHAGAALAGSRALVAGPQRRPAPTSGLAFGKHGTFSIPAVSITSASSGPGPTHM